MTPIRSFEEAFNRIEPADLMAVHLMGMNVSPTATRTLLGAGQQSVDVSNLLRKVPEVDIWDDAANFEAANELWQLLARCKKHLYPGINWVTAGNSWPESGPV